VYCCWLAAFIVVGCLCVFLCLACVLFVDRVYCCLLALCIVVGWPAYFGWFVVCIVAG
jgi:hypothetical protein